MESLRARLKLLQYDIAVILILLLSCSFTASLWWVRGCLLPPQHAGPLIFPWWTQICHLSPSLSPCACPCLGGCCKGTEGIPCPREIRPKDQVGLKECKRLGHSALILLWRVYLCIKWLSKTVNDINCSHLSHLFNLFISRRHIYPLLFENIETLVPVNTTPT